MAEQVNVVQSLFGLTPTNVQRQLDAEAERRAMELASLSRSPVAASEYYGLRSAERFRNAPLFGQNPRVAQAEQVQGVVQSLQQQGVDMATPEGMIQLAGELNKNPEFSGMALALRQQATQMQAKARRAILEEGRIISETEENIAQAGKARREQEPKPTATQEQVRIDKFAQIRSKYPDTIEGRAKAATEFAEWESSFKQREAAAGVPAPGMVSTRDIEAGQRIVDQYVKGSREKLDQIQPLRTQIQEARAGSGAAMEQVRGQLIKLVGDSQISQAERARITGSSGIVGDAINKINTLITGVPTSTKFDEIDKIIAALEDVYGTKYNKGVDKADSVLGQVKLDPQTRATLLPSKYKSGLQTKREGTQTFQNNKMYKDSQGNFALYSNGQWVPVRQQGDKWVPVQ
jgi:hypothetical protein